MQCNVKGQYFFVFIWLDVFSMWMCFFFAFMEGYLVALRCLNYQTIDFFSFFQSLTLLPSLEISIWNLYNKFRMTNFHINNSHLIRMKFLWRQISNCLNIYAVNMKPVSEFKWMNFYLYA